MKKIKYLLMCFICLLLIGCGTSNNKKEIGSVDDFKKYATDNGFVVEDNGDNYLDIDYISDAMKATLDDVKIEMIIYTDSDSATKVQDEQINSFRILKSTGATEHKDKGKNYYQFWMISNGYYMISSRIDNTLIFAKTLLANKEAVENVFNSMGY